MKNFGLVLGVIAAVITVLVFQRDFIYGTRGNLGNFRKIFRRGLRGLAKGLPHRHSNSSSGMDRVSPDPVAREMALNGHLALHDDRQHG